MTNTLVRRDEPDNRAALAYTIIFALWMGFRPTGLGWGDSGLYRHAYYLKMHGGVSNFASDRGEILWEWIQDMFIQAHIPVTYFFLLVCSCYMGFMYLAVRRMISCNQWIAILFCIASFSFFGASYNALRNGMACSILLYGFSYYITGQKKDLIIGIVLSIIAMGVHKSTFLPSVCMLSSWFGPKNMRWTLYFWLFSIFLSLTIGGLLQNFFANLGFDDRMNGYAGTDVGDSRYANQFSSTGFRWDFLLYSMMPILLAYYVIIKRKAYNWRYVLLINTYILANSFWVMVIKAQYSNRFAYLSWFMYPIVIAYPLLKIPFRRDQDKFTAYVLLAYMGFTLFMNVIYYR